MPEMGSIADTIMFLHDEPLALTHNLPVSCMNASTLRRFRFVQPPSWLNAHDFGKLDHVLRRFFVAKHVLTVPWPWSPR